jgi:hypothetical protein
MLRKEGKGKRAS